MRFLIGQQAIRNGNDYYKLHFHNAYVHFLWHRYKARNAQGQVGLVPRNYLQELSEYLTQPYQDRRQERVEDRPSENLMDRPHLVGKPWYYGSITRNQCDSLLNQHGHDGDFLIRDSETNVSINKIYL